MFCATLSPKTTLRLYEFQMLSETQRQCASVGKLCAVSLGLRVGMPVMLPAVHRLFQQPYGMLYSCYENVTRN
jgi:hypothetical protein